jgi:hypothetical protein
MAYFDPKPLALSLVVTLKLMTDLRRRLRTSELLDNLISSSLVYKSWVMRIALK